MSVFRGEGSDAARGREGGGVPGSAGGVPGSSSGAPGSSGGARGRLKVCGWGNLSDCSGGDRQSAEPFERLQSA